MESFKTFCWFETLAFYYFYLEKIQLFQNFCLDFATLSNFFGKFFYKYIKNIKEIG